MNRRSFKIKRYKSNLELWSKNIAYNYNHDLGTNLYSQLIDAKNDLQLDMSDIDERWQEFSAGDRVKWQSIYWLLTGEIRTRFKKR